MSIVLGIILFVASAMVQLLCARKAVCRLIRYIPVIVSAAGVAFAIGVHVCALAAYRMGTASGSVLAENQVFAAFLLSAAGICLCGSVIGFLMAKRGG